MFRWTAGTRARAERTARADEVVAKPTRTALSPPVSVPPRPPSTMRSLSPSPLTVPAATRRGLTTTSATSSMTKAEQLLHAMLHPPASTHVRIGFETAPTAEYTHRSEQSRRGEKHRPSCHDRAVEQRRAHRARRSHNRFVHDRRQATSSARRGRSPFSSPSRTDGSTDFCFTHSQEEARHAPMPLSPSPQAADAQQPIEHAYAYPAPAAGTAMVNADTASSVDVRAPSLASTSALSSSTVDCLSLRCALVAPAHHPPLATTTDTATGTLNDTRPAAYRRLNPHGVDGTLSETLWDAEQRVPAHLLPLVKTSRAAQAWPSSSAQDVLSASAGGAARADETPTAQGVNAVDELFSEMPPLPGAGNTTTPFPWEVVDAAKDDGGANAEAGTMPLMLLRSPAQKTVADTPFTSTGDGEGQAAGVVEADPWTATSTEGKPTPRAFTTADMGDALAAPLAYTESEARHAWVPDEAARATDGCHDGTRRSTLRKAVVGTWPSPPPQAPPCLWSPEASEADALVRHETAAPAPLWPAQPTRRFSDPYPVEGPAGCRHACDAERWQASAQGTCPPLDPTFSWPACLDADQAWYTPQAPFDASDSHGSRHQSQHLVPRAAQLWMPAPDSSARPHLSQDGPSAYASSTVVPPSAFGFPTTSVSGAAAPNARRGRPPAFAAVSGTGGGRHTRRYREFQAMCYQRGRGGGRGGQRGYWA